MTTTARESEFGDDWRQKSQT